MSEYLHKAHNVSVLIYHIVCPAKYRRVVIDENVDMTIRDVCQEIEKRYEIKFLEIGTEEDHVHFLVQSVPRYSPTQIVRTIKSIVAKKVFEKHPEVKKKLWGGEFWTDGYFVNTVGQQGNEETITNYVKLQGKENKYRRLYKIADEKQLSLFDESIKHPS
jgi:REP element-mobilizing transposase RayT